MSDQSVPLKWAGIIVGSLSSAVSLVSGGYCGFVAVLGFIADADDLKLRMILLCSLAAAGAVVGIACVIRSLRGRASGLLVLASCAAAVGAGVIALSLAPSIKVAV